MKKEYNGVIFNIDYIIKKENKRSYISFKTPTDVLFKLNIKMSDKAFEKLVDDNILFIYNTHLKLKKKMNDFKTKDDEIHLLGKLYKLVLIKANENQIFQDDKNIYVKYQSEYFISSQIKSLYNEYLQNIVKNNIDVIKERFKIEFDIKFEYKAVKTYFGECFIKEHKIVLASFLAKYEYKYILSVIYHEMTHFFVRGHQEDFYDKVEEVFPGYKECLKELRKIRYQDKY